MENEKFKMKKALIVQGFFHLSKRLIFLL